MQVKIALLLVASLMASMPASADPGRDRDRPREPRRHDRWPGVIVEPNIVIERDRGRTPNVDAPEFVMAELSRCVAAGVRLFVDCLRHNHGSIMIRRLEACVQSETIPDDPKRIEPCLPLPASAAP